MKETKKKLTRKKANIGSDCMYCSLEEGVYSMMYFCKHKSKNLDEHHRVICEDGFKGECELYKKQK